MSDPTISSQFASLLPVLLGGALAISGGLLSQIVIHLLGSSRERTKLRRDRIEGLVKALFSYEQWLDEKRIKSLFRNEDHDSPSPLDDVRMIQALHFPELAEEVNQVQKAYVPMLNFFNEQRAAYIKDKDNFFANFDSTPYFHAYEQHLIASRALMDKCRRLIEMEA